MDSDIALLYGIIVLSALLGGLQCFFGYRLFRFVLMIKGFLVGGFVAGAIAFAATEDLAVGLFIGILGGLVLAAVMVPLYFAGVFIMGALLGGVATSTILLAAEVEPVPLAVLVVGIVAGFLAVKLEQLMIIVSTAFIGSWLLVCAIALSVARPAASAEESVDALAEGTGVLVVAWLFVGVVGAAFQYQEQRSSSARDQASQSPP